MINLKQKRGSEVITTPIIIALGIILIAIFIVFAVKVLTPYIWYEKLSSTCLKYVFVMEEYGYLTTKEKNNLKSELVSQGFEEKNLKVFCTNRIQAYGNPIYLKVDYIYNLDLPIVGEKNIQMNVTRETVSKR